MKIGLSTLLALSFTASVLGQEVSSFEAVITSQVLSKLTDKAIVDGRNDLVAVYYAAFQSIKMRHKTLSTYDEYFEEVATSYENTLGRWVVGLEYPPEEFQVFLHKEIPPGENPCEKGTTPKGQKPVLKKTNGERNAAKIKQ
ncbi:hypothetical protein N9954_06780 [Maribacter sp.]|nr:hypothetical protein [Maribacter sp.]